jgi:hypothetical protein
MNGRKIGNVKEGNGDVPPQGVKPDIIEKHLRVAMIAQLSF